MLTLLGVLGIGAVAALAVGMVLLRERCVSTPLHAGRGLLEAPSLSIAVAADGLRAVLAAAASRTHDIAQGGGALHQGPSGLTRTSRPRTCDQGRLRACHELSVRAPSLCVVIASRAETKPHQISGAVRSVAPRPAADEGLARRLKALACTAPLHDLDARKANLAGEYSTYAMAELALAVIDLVTLHMDFDTGADHDQIIARLLPRVAAQAPQRSVEEHERVARWVLENLINVGSIDRGFRAVYGTFRPDGTYVRRDYDFKLIEEVPGAGGSVYLRATDEAVNVLVGALDTDVTSAQIAAEVKLEVLISRGRLADAQLAAEQARYRTVQYAESLRRALAATRRDVRAVDWLRAIPDMIDEALEHIADRYRHENAILTNIRKARDEATDPEHKRHAAELVDIVRDCIRRHTQLQSRLLEAGPLFRAEQDRQAFATPPARAGLDLYGQLLAPLLPLPVERASRVTYAFFGRGTGLRTPAAVRIADLVEALLSPPQEREHLGAEMPEPDLVATSEDSRFTDEQLEAALELLDLPHDAPRRLSGLLAEARRRDPELPYLVALLALHAASPPVGTAYRQGEWRLLFAVDDGTELDDPQFGGADLVVGAALLDTAEMAAQRAMENAMEHPEPMNVAASTVNAANRAKTGGVADTENAENADKTEEHSR